MAWFVSFSIVGVSGILFFWPSFSEKIAHSKFKDDFIKMINSFKLKMTDRKTLTAEELNKLQSGKVNTKTNFKELLLIFGVVFIVGVYF